jgi:hypothetical protein
MGKTSNVVPLRRAQSKQQQLFEPLDPSKFTSRQVRLVELANALVSGDERDWGRTALAREWIRLTKLIYKDLYVPGPAKNCDIDLLETAIVARFYTPTSIMRAKHGEIAERDFASARVIEMVLVLGGVFDLLAVGGAE